MNRKKAVHRIAINMALKSPSKFRVGAVVFKKNILSAGYNQRKTHPLLSKIGNQFMKGLHAELHACIGLDAEQMEGASIYVVRLKLDGSIGLAKPCKMCQTYLREVGFKTAYYSTNSAEIGCIKL